MGDRANVEFVDGATPIYFYTHWSGTELPQIVRNALERGRTRWDDGQYLARIIFCEMIQGDVLDTTGYGISSYIGDGDGRIVSVNVREQKISIGPNVWSFEEYIQASRGWR